MFEPRHHRVVDESSGLRAFVVIDDTSLGPAAGGIRTREYRDEAQALADAQALARAMTYKCALGGVPAGGGKGVVMASETMDRRRAFEYLGDFVDGLGGEFLTAGDLGTTRADLQAMAGRTSFVHTDEVGLSRAVGRGCVRAMEACAAFRGLPGGSLSGLRIAVQGCGTVGEAVAKQARDLGAELLVADIDSAVADRVAADVNAEVVTADEILGADVDILSPCAVGGVLTEAAVDGLACWAVCGGANNILASADVEDELMAKATIWVPDPLSSSGAVIEGVGRTILGLEQCDELVDRVGDTTLRVLVDARRQGRRAGDVARDLARHRILTARER